MLISWLALWSHVIKINININCSVCLLCIQIIYKTMQVNLYITNNASTHQDGGIYAFNLSVCLFDCPSVHLFFTIGFFPDPKTTNPKWFPAGQSQRQGQGIQHYGHKVSFGMSDSNVCTFCDSEEEKISHLFYDCKYVEELWQRYNVIICISKSSKCFSIKAFVKN